MRNGTCMVGPWYQRGHIISKHKMILDKYEPLVSDRIAQVFKQRDISIFNNVNVREVKRINSTNKQENSSSVQIVLDDGHTTITAEELLVAVGRKPRQIN